jgi:ABC-type glycerol-3-phosphate transport system permease component
VTATPTSAAAQAAETQIEDETLEIARRRHSEGKRAERKLGLLLVAPAVIVMLAVAAYPIIYAFWLSLNKADLRLPDQNEFVWFSNYVTVLSSPIWWTAFGVTIFITVVSASLELVFGMLLAIVMHRTLVGRGLVRTSALVPYAIVTVVAAFSWRFAWTQDLGWLAPGDAAPLTQFWPSIWIIILAEVWKTVPFMALLLMAGLALVPEDLLKAASMDGANPWKRFWMVTVPLIKPAILVALLFRTLDAFRVFDNIYVLTGGANQTSSVSMVAYNNLIRGLNLGIGSTMAVLIFITTGIIAFIFIKAFGAVAVQPETTNRKLMWWGVNTVVLLYAFIPVIWIVSLSLKDDASLNDGKYFPVSPSSENYSAIFQNEDFTRALINSIGICLISTGIAIVFGTMAAYAVARLDFPGKKAVVAAALLISMFPQIALVTPLFKIETTLNLFDTWAGLIIPYVTFALPLAIYTLSAFFREIPWDLEKAARMDGATPYQAFRQVITPLAMPGVFTTGILVFISCWNDFLFAISLTSTSASRTVPAAMSYFTGATTFEKPTGPIAAAAVVITIPIVLFVLFFQRRIVAGLTSGAVKG